MGCLKGWIYFLLWYSSILAGSYLLTTFKCFSNNIFFSGYAALFCPLLPILIISNKLYRFLTDVFFTFWQSYPTVSELLRSDGEIVLLIVGTSWDMVWLRYTDPGGPNPCRRGVFVSYEPSNKNWLEFFMARRLSLYEGLEALQTPHEICSKRHHKTSPRDWLYY